jgi:ribosomal protein S18 acetylase RimI-like enzyme
MTNPIELRVNSASAIAIAAHLRRSDDDFVPRLSDRVDIDEYSRKIAERAIRFEGWWMGSLVGLVAAYFEADGVTAYITNVSVDPQLRKRGFASQLLAQCVEYARDRGYTGVHLEVGMKNQSAIDLYEREGFGVANESEGTVSMRRNIQTSGRQE